MSDDIFTENILERRMKPLKAVLFDLDGTLFDTEGQYSVFWGEMGRTYRPDVPDLEKIIKGTTLTQIFDRFFPDAEVQAAITTRLNEWEKTMRYEFVPGALEFIHDIRKHGVRCAVVTSSNQAKMQSVMAQVPDFAALFDRILTSEDFAESKPSPDCYLRGAAALGAEIDECVVFEDAFTGLEAGMSAGIFTFGLTTNNPREAIIDKCSHVLPDFTGLTYRRAELLRMAQVAPAQLIFILTDDYLRAVDGALTADNIDRLTADQHALLCYRYLLDEVMEGGFIQLIANGLAPYVLCGPFPMMVKKMWGMRDLSKLLYEAKRLYYIHGEDITRDMSDDDFMALYEQMEDLNDLGDDFLDEHQETATPAVAQMVASNIEQYEMN